MLEFGACKHPNFELITLIYVGKDSVHFGQI